MRESDVPTQLNLAAAGSVCKIWAFRPVHKEKGSARSIYSEDLWSWLNRRPLEGSALLVVRADRSRLERREALASLRQNRSSAMVLIATRKHHGRCRTGALCGTAADKFPSA